METDPWLKKTAAITDPHLLPLFVNGFMEQPQYSHISESCHLEAGL